MRNAERSALFVGAEVDLEVAVGAGPDVGPVGFEQLGRRRTET
jgi:hypothetical protein